MPNLAKRFIPHFFIILCGLFLLASAPQGQAQITLGPATLPAGAVGATYAQVINATGAVAPVHFTVSSGTLPVGLKLGAPADSLFATIGGVPTGTAGPSTFTVQATDSSTPPQTTSITYTLTIAAADSSNDAELKGTYCFLFQGFSDADSSMEVVAASFTTDGQGNVMVGFEDALGSGGAQPTEEVTGQYWLGANNRGTMELMTAGGGTVLIAFTAGNIVDGVVTKARLIRFDDVDGTSGHTGSGVMFKQNPATFMLSALNGSYAFSEVGSLVLAGVPENGNPQSAVGLAIFDGVGNFVNGSMVDINNAGNLQTSEALSGTYALSNETVSNGRLTLSPVIAGNNGTVSDVAYIIDDTQFIFISIDATSDVIYGGIAELQTTPGNFGLGSLNGFSVMALQGKQTNGVATVAIGSLSTTGDTNFSFDYVQQTTTGDTPQTTGIANGTVAVMPNGRAVLTFPQEQFSPIILYLSGPNQGFAAETDTASSTGPLDPGGNNFNNATLATSANFFGGSVNPPTPQTSDEVTVLTFGATTYTAITDGSTMGTLAADLMPAPNGYTVAADGQLTVPNSGGVIGYVASACKTEVLLQSAAGPGLGTTECQGASTPANETLTVTKAGTGTGTVTSAPAGINCGATCAAPFASGTQVTLTAAPATGSTFTGWDAPCSGTGNCIVTLTAATTVTATFTPTATNFTLTVTKAGTGTGTVTSAPAGINCGATCAAPFASGTQVTLTAAPATGSTFTGWGAPCSGTGTCVVTLTVATTVTATFTLSTTNFALTVTEAGTGTGTVMSTPAGIACQPTCITNFASGQVVALSATAAAGSTFAGWTGAGCSGTAGCSVTMTAAQAVTATFTKSATNVALTVTEAGTGTGTVMSTPAGIACQPTCVANFASGQVVALTATAAAGSTFAGWTGAGPCEGTEVCMFDITVATSVTANFTKNVTNVTLTVAETGTGTGTVTSAPAGIACQPTCSASFASGQAVALTATAAAGSTFAGWSGAGCSGTAGCSVALTAATTVTAMFNKSTTNFMLTVTEAGSGTGTVTSAPTGIACQPMCSASFASGQVVALTATAAEGSTFGGWSGGGCNGTGGCSVTVTAATAVTATFNSNNSSVTITVKPGTPSTVSTTPGGGAVFGLLLTSLPGTTGSVMLGCTSSSPDITCQIVPNTITLNGKGTEVAIVVNTFCTAAAPGPVPGQFPRGTPGGFVLLLAVLSLVLCGATWKMKSQPRWAISCAALILMTVGMSACASLPKSPGGQATPPGNYPLVVTATAPNGSTSSVNLTLTVVQ